MTAILTPVRGLDGHAGSVTAIASHIGSGQLAVARGQYVDVYTAGWWSRPLSRLIARARLDVDALQFSADGALLMAASDYGEVTVWDHHGTIVAWLDTGQVDGRKAVFHPTRRSLVFLSGEGEVIDLPLPLGQVVRWSWDEQAGEGRRVVGLDDQTATALAVTADASQVLIGTEGGQVRRYRFADGARLAEEDLHGRPVRGIVVREDATCLTFTDEEAVVHDIGTTARQRVAFEQTVADVTFGADGNLLVTVDNLVARVDPETATGEVIDRFDVHARAAAALPDGASACASIAAEVRIVDSRGQKAATLTGSSHYVQTLAAQPGGSLFATGHWDGTVILWDAASLQPQVTLSTQRIVMGTAFSADGQYLLSLGYDSLHLSASVWDVPTPAELGALGGRPLTAQGSVEPSHIWRLTEMSTGHEGYVGSGADVALAPGGSAFLVNADAQPTLYATGTGAPLARLTSGLRIVAYAAAGALVRTKEGSAWFTFEDGRLTPLNLPSDMNWEGISSNGRHIVGTDGEEAVRVYDRERGSFGPELQAPDVLVDGTPFTAAAGERWCVTDDGRFAACCSSEHEVFVWEAATGTCIRTVTDLVRFPGHLTFTGDGSRLLVSVGSESALGSVTVIDLPTT